MASAALLVHFKKQRRAMVKTTQTVSQLAPVHQYLTGKESTTLLQDHFLAMQAECNFPITQSLWPDFQPEHTLFLTSFAQFLFVVVARLDKLSRASDAREEFWLLWSMLSYACHASQRWSIVLPFDLRRQHSQLLPILHLPLQEMMSWLLFVTRDNGPVWQCMLKERSAQLIHDQIISMLSTPINCIINIPANALIVDVQQICAMPGDFMPLLFCLVSELLGVSKLFSVTAGGLTTADQSTSGTPSKIVDPIYITTLAEIITLMVSKAIKQEYETVECTHPDTLDLLKRLCGPAAIHVMKLGIAIKGTQKTLQTCTSEPCMVSTLCTLISSTSDPVHGSNFQSKTSAYFTPRRLISDQQLLVVLCNLVTSNPQSSHANLMLMFNLFRHWELGYLEHENPKIDSAHCASLLTLAHHCSMLTLIWMQQSQTKEQRQQQCNKAKTSLTNTSQHLQWKQALSHLPVLLVFRNLAALVGKLCVQAVSTKIASGVFRN